MEYRHVVEAVSEADHRWSVLPKPTVVELALGGAALPYLLAAAPLAALVRSATLAQYATHCDASHSLNLTGKTPDGRPLRAQHRHAHFLPEARGGEARVTHVVVWAPEGFEREEVGALAAVRILNLKNLGMGRDVRGAPPRSRQQPILRVVVSAVGYEDDFRDQSPLFGRARAWRSRTPFVLPRHPKRGRESAPEQLRRELTLRGLPLCESLEPVHGPALGLAEGGPARLTRWAEFDVRRDRDRPTTSFTGFRLRFAEPVAGPLQLGWGCHYGLGGFEPETDADTQLASVESRLPNRSSTEVA